MVSNNDEPVMFCWGLDFIRGFEYDFSAYLEILNMIWYNFISKNVMLQDLFLMWCYLSCLYYCGAKTSTDQNGPLDHFGPHTKWAVLFILVFSNLRKLF